MNEPQMTQTGTERTEAATMERSTGKSQITPEQEIVMRLKQAIDQRGRYSYRLNDMAAGYAAGKNVSALEARQTIENEFERQLGKSPQAYLDHHYQEYKNTRSNSRGR